METMGASDLAAFLGVTERRAQQVLRVLEAGGFAVERDAYGGRRIPEGLARLIGRLREEGKPLEALLREPEAAPFLRRKPEIALAEAVGESLHLLAQLRRALRALGRAYLPPWPPASSWYEAGLTPPQEEEGL